jgi:hypothetical protein
LGDQGSGRKGTGILDADHESRCFVWEHAFLLDYQPAERPQYIEAFFSNINWQAVEGRLIRRAQAQRT